MTTTDVDGLSTPDADQLRVRAVAHVDRGEPGVREPYGDWFDLEVVEDRPGGPRLLTEPDLAVLGYERPVVVDLARRNTVTRVLSRVDVHEHRLPGGGQVLLAAADGVPYVSAGVTSVPTLLPGDLPYGAFVAAPALSAVLLMRVVSHASLRSLVVLGDLTGPMYDQAADPCRREVFWWYEGALHRVEVQTGEHGSAQLVLPPPVLAVAESLPA